MLYLIGLGLNVKGISQEGADAVQGCDKVYLENYTVEFPYTKKILAKELYTEILDADRKTVESDFLIKEAKGCDVTLLVYGAPLAATTHISLIQDAKKAGVKVKVIHAGSIFDAVGETGLQMYKFGKTASMPNHEAYSFMEMVKENLSIGAHSLVLVDIGLEYSKSLEKLKSAANENGVKLDRIVICSKMGTKEQKMFYGEIEILYEKEVKAPFCFIIPGKLHFLEEELLGDL